MMEANHRLAHDWLHFYGNEAKYRWQRTRNGDQITFERPLGLVETSFDSDGRYNEGRADMQSLLEVEIRTSLNDVSVRERILLAWTRLRFQHPLLQASSIGNTKPSDTRHVAGTHFVISMVISLEEAVSEARKHLVFLEDHFDDIGPLNFFNACQNVARVVDPGIALSKLFVFRPKPTRHGRSMLKVIFVGAHQIWDGLSNYVATRDFISFLNQNSDKLRHDTTAATRPGGIERNLPLPQEALYPQVPGSVAKQRWFWLITRVLRHVRRQLPIGFANPLLRKDGRRGSVSYAPAFEPVLDYNRTPPLNSRTILVHIPRDNTQRLHRLCKEAKASVGSGCFALAALSMMEMYEAQEPNVKPEERKCFISGFPLNPRAFFNHATEPNSLMLAFSDGIALPFLSSDLDLEGRIRLLARQAHRQLASYQKRARPKGDDASQQYLNSRGAGLVLANQYLLSLERANALLPEELRQGINLQGKYPARQNPTSQTCGVSSVGRRDAILRSGVFDLDDTSKDFAADFRSLNAQSVRARDGEFLIGIGGSADGLWASCSADVSSLDPGLIEQWRHKFEHILDDDSAYEEARL